MFSIRQAQEKDTDTIAGFQLRLAQETEDIKLELTIVLRGVKALLDDPSKGSYYVAEKDGTVAGCFLITFEWSEWRNGTVWWLQSVFVDKKFRNQGVFKKMYEYVMERISADPTLLGLRLYVDKSNGSAQNVYASLGMNGDHYTVFEWMRK
jgi:ribosomal protein S18 acetylase RimI-like enzyme